MQTSRGTAESYETFGRLMTLLLHGGPLGGSTTAGELNAWEKLGGGFAVSWTRGPHAAEVARVLRVLADDDEATDVLRSGDVTDVVDREGTVTMRVRGLPVDLRPDDTLGTAAEWAQTLESVRSTR